MMVVGSTRVWAAALGNELQSHPSLIHGLASLPIYENTIDSDELSEEESEHEISENEDEDHEVYQNADEGEFKRVKYPENHNYGKDLDEKLYHEPGLDVDESKKIIITIDDSDRHRRYSPYDLDYNNYIDDYYGYNNMYNNIMPFGYQNPRTNNFNNNPYNTHMPFNRYNPHIPNLPLNNRYNSPFPINNRYNAPLPINNRFNNPLAMNNFPINNGIGGSIGGGYAL